MNLIIYLIFSHCNCRLPQRKPKAKGRPTPTPAKQEKPNTCTRNPKDDRLLTSLLFSEIQFRLSVENIQSKSTHKSIFDSSLSDRSQVYFIYVCVYIYMYVCISIGIENNLFSTFENSFYFVCFYCGNDSGNILFLSLECR